MPNGYSTICQIRIDISYVYDPLQISKKGNIIEAKQFSDFYEVSNDFRNARAVEV